MKKSNERLIRREEIELAKWRREQNRKTFTGYLIIMIIMMCLIRVIDEFATNTFNSLQTSVINEFYVLGKGMSFDEGLSSFSLITTGASMVAIAAVLYTILCDRFGRKSILILSVLGMAVGMALCWWSPDLTTFWVGRILIVFFTAADIHQIYIIEIAPTEKRATWLSVSSFVSYLGLMSISLARMANTHGEELNWRGVMAVPSIAALLCLAFLLIFARETPAFLKQRIEYLEKPFELREAEKLESKKNKEVQSKEAGLGPAFKYLFSHKQAFFCFLAGQIHMVAMMAYAFYYETLMTSSGMSTTMVNSALFIYPVSMALVSILVGVIADKFGRKAAGIVSSAVAFTALALFIAGVSFGWNAYIVGLLYGCEIGAYWQFGAMAGLSLKESVPTRIRASMGAVSGIFGTFVNLISMVAVSIIVGIAGIKPVCLVLGLVALGIAAMVFAIFAKETKGADLDAIE